MAASAAALAALVTIPYATGLVTVAPVLQAPAGRSQALTGMQPFGEQYQRFAFTVHGTTIMISPPASYDGTPNDTMAVKRHVRCHGTALFAVRTYVRSSTGDATC